LELEEKSKMAKINELEQKDINEARANALTALIQE
jgi:hypothetical protein